MTSLRFFGVLVGSVAVVVVACNGETEEGSGQGNVGVTASSTSSGMGGATTATASSSTGSMMCETTNLSITCATMTTTADETACNLINQDCADAGSWCNVVGNASACVPYQGGVKGHGQACAADSECQRGLSCIGNECTAFCCPDTQEPCCGGLCDVNVDFGGGATALMCSYAPACDLLQDNCPPGLDCHPAAIAQALAVCDDPSMTAVPEGGTCMFRNDCGESQFCNTNEGGPNDGICRQLCSLSTWMTDTVPTGGCDANRTCMSVNWGNSQWTDIGMCLP